MVSRNKKLRRSPFFYVGDKYKLIPQLKDSFPLKINRFIEPFCGGGSCFLNIDANSYLLNDIDNNIISLHKFLISFSGLENLFWSKIIELIDMYSLSASFLGLKVPEELRIAYPKTYFAKYNKNSYYKMREDYNKSRSPFLLYLLLIYGFNRFLRFNSKSDFNLPVGNVDFNSNVKTALDEYFNFVYGKNMQFSSKDFEIFIEEIEPQSDDLIYLDPPYLITSCEYNKMWNEQDEIRLISCLDALNKNGVKFAISNILWHRKQYNGIFNEWAQKYNITKINSNYISFHDNTTKDSIEVLVKNF